VLGRMLTEQQRSVDGAAAFVAQKGRGHVFFMSRVFAATSSTSLGASASPSSGNSLTM